MYKTQDKKKWEATNINVVPNKLIKDALDGDRLTSVVEIDITACCNQMKVK